MSTTELSSKVKELKELQQLIEEATVEAEALKDQIKAEMTARSVDEMSVGLFKIRWTKVKSTRFDTTAFKKAMPELAQQFTRTAESRRFSVA
ncbi:MULTISPECIES: hypothetical protein [Eubacteriales]|uniref:Uncharacterized protein n=1 Tax=Bittarella massiliensis (ex Durand et al. 2017) TaxID=1720313 RepID=A0AAQ1RW46_9FIRM|nr:MULTISPECIES: hypothetical protein [Eubacteriales]SHG16758.1 hypothetical protein SAMN05444424_1721 [Bittarella massiliensis (ex Durand et al. 2017)]SHG17092.1 hypothetical protein SAMN05444424_1733 [Bittarella massiliensis (ex Durand et al. 2017)]